MVVKKVIGLVVLLIFAAVANGGLTYEGSVEYTAGTGENEAMIVIDFDFEEYFVFGYRWNGDASGWDALEAIAQAGALEVDAQWYEEFGNHFVSDFIYPDGEAYDYGGAITGWGYWGSDDGESWAVNTGVDGRVLGDGDWDSWTWSNYDFDISWDPQRSPGEAPVPEPVTLCLFGAGILLFRRFRF